MVKRIRMFLRFLLLFLSIEFSAYSADNFSPVVDLSHLKNLPDICSLQEPLLDCGIQDLTLSSSAKLGTLKVKAGRISIQGKIEADQLRLEATKNISIPHGASLFLQKTLSLETQGEFRVQGGLFAAT